METRSVFRGEVSAVPGKVGYWRESGRHALYLTFAAFDPKLTDMTTKSLATSWLTFVLGITSRLFMVLLDESSQRRRRMHVYATPDQQIRGVRAATTGVSGFASRMACKSAIKL